MSKPFTVLVEPSPDDPHGVTVAATPDGVELWRTRTTGSLSLFHLPAREVPAVFGALQAWLSHHRPAVTWGPKSPEPTIGEEDRREFLEILYQQLSEWELDEMDPAEGYHDVGECPCGQDHD